MKKKSLQTSLRVTAPILQKRVAPVSGQGTFSNPWSSSENLHLPSDSPTPGLCSRLWSPCLWVHGRESTDIRGTSQSQAGSPLRPQPSPVALRIRRGCLGWGEAERKEQWAFKGMMGLVHEQGTLGPNGQLQAALKTHS